MEDELEGLRAHFPVSFGKTSKVSASTEAIHSATRRTDVANDAGVSSDITTKKPDSDKSGFPSLSSSSQTWLRSVRGPNRNPNSSGDVAMGPPPPPSSKRTQEEEEEDEEVMMGPPPPPKGLGNINDSDDEGDMIGPPPPPPAARDSDEDSDDDDDNDNEENRYQIPLSNEIQLKGHTKVYTKLLFEVVSMEILNSKLNKGFCFLESDCFISRC